MMMVYLRRDSTCFDLLTALVFDLPRKLADQAPLPNNQRDGCLDSMIRSRGNIKSKIRTNKCDECSSVVRQEWTCSAWVYKSVAQK